MDLTTREAASRLGVNQARVRALAAAGTLAARRVGSQWLIDADSVDQQAALIGAGATSRAMASRIAWAASDLADGGRAGWLNAVERHRVRNRVAGAASALIVQRWFSARAVSTRRYAVGTDDLEGILGDSDVVATGISAAAAYRLGLTNVGAGDAYVTATAVDRLVRDHFLIQSTSGNLTLRLVDNDLHLATARTIDGLRVATRLIVGVDLAEDADARTRAAGLSLIDRVLDEQRRARHD